MKQYTKLYMRFFGYGETDFMCCEICGSCANDCHHIERRGMGGTKKKDTIENIMALCRNCHNKYGDVPKLKSTLKEVHANFIKYNKSDEKKLAKLYLTPEAKIPLFQDFSLKNLNILKKNYGEF